MARNENAPGDCSGRSPGASKGETAQDGIGKVGETALCLNADTLGGMSVRRNLTPVRQWAFEIDQKWRAVRRSMSKFIDSITF